MEQQYKIVRVRYSDNYFCDMDAETQEYANALLKLSTGKTRNTKAFKIKKEHWEILENFISVEDVTLIDWLGVDCDKLSTILSKMDSWKLHSSLVNGVRRKGGIQNNQN